jgi:aminopeptidase-like protein
MLWTLNSSDGDHSVLDIADHAKLDFRELAEVAGVLVQHNLLRKIV